MSLSILEPEKFKELQDIVATENAERQYNIEQIRKTIIESLDRMNIKAEVNGRCKTYYSIYNKMIKQQKDISEIFDLYALRIIVDSVKECYGALGVIHTKWKPIPGRAAPFPL